MSKEEVGTSLGELLSEALTETFGMPPEQVADKIVKHTGGHFVRVRYEKSRHGFILRGEVMLLEKLNLPVRMQGRNGFSRDRWGDAVLTVAAKVRPRYTGSGIRVKGSEIVTDNTGLEFQGIVRYSTYRPKGLLFERISGRDAMLLATGIGWENFFRRAEVELARRIKDWRKSNKKARKSGKRKVV